MNIAWNYKREHLRIQQRSHYVITNGGDQPNVVPPNASVWYYFRETDYDHIKELWELGDTMAKAAAMMTGTTVESRVLGSAWPQHGNRPIAQAMHANILQVGHAAVERGGSAVRAGVSARAGRAERGLSTTVAADAQRPRVDSRQREDRRRFRRHRRHHVERADGQAAASRRTFLAPPAITGRARWRWPRRSRTRAPPQGAKVEAMTALDLLMRPELVTARPRVLRERAEGAADATSRCCGPKTSRPIWLNKETMDRFKPELRKFYYDPTRYKSLPRAARRAVSAADAAGAGRSRSDTAINEGQRQ